jgi:hypothetical protein
MNRIYQANSQKGAAPQAAENKKPPDVKPGGFLKETLLNRCNPD